MTWYRTCNKDVVLIREYFYYTQSLDLHTVSAHTACHTHSFEYTAWVRRPADRTRGALTIVLAMGCFTHTAKSMALHNTLESLTLGGAYYSYFLTFSEDLTSDLFANLLIYGTITYFFYYRLRRCICLREVIEKPFGSVLFFSFSVCYLQAFITVGIYGLLLCNYTRTSFDDGAGCLLTIRLKHTGHAEFLTNNTFHYLMFKSSARLPFGRSGMNRLLLLLKN